MNISLSNGTTLHNGKYKVVKTLGQDGFSITYLAAMTTTVRYNEFEETEITVEVVIKEFFMRESSKRTSDGVGVEDSSEELFVIYRQKFRQEAENRSHLESSNVIKVLDVFDENNTTYYVLEYTDGINLDEDILQNRGNHEYRPGYGASQSQIYGRSVAYSSCPRESSPLSLESKGKSSISKILTIPFTVIAAPISFVAYGVSSVVGAIKEKREQTKKHKLLYHHEYNVIDEDLFFSSIFAPAEVKRKSRMLVQIYIHRYDETDKVKTLASETDKNAERRDYIPLQYELKIGDRVDMQLNIYGETLLFKDKKNVVWQGSFTKCSFDYFIPKDIDVNELSCVGLITVNGLPIGEMRFITKIVDAPRRLNSEIIAHKYNKVFISYSHQDESKVKFLHEGLELGAVPHFFDRKYLKAGDVFPQVIRDYINSADLFILCWSENASKSEYVQKERLQALERAFPQVKPAKDAKLRIYPMSIEPRAELPSDMKDYYHFGEI